MPNINIRAVNYNCLRCKQEPAFALEPCGHKLCYDHYLRKNWSLRNRQDFCAHCGKTPANVVELPQQKPVVDIIQYTDTTWSVEQNRDLDDEWPSSKMYGNLEDMYGRNPDYAYNGRYYYDDATHDGYPTLRDGTVARQQPHAFPPPASIAPPPAFGYQQSNGVGRGGHGNTARHGGFSGARAPSVVSSANRTFAPSQAGAPLYHHTQSNMRFNPQAPRYVPTPTPAQQNLMVEPFVRPESSISNHTFATQLPQRGPMSSMHMAHPTPRRTYNFTAPEAFGDGTNGLGARLDNLSIKAHQPYGPPSTVNPSTVNEDVFGGLNAQNGALARRSDSDKSSFSRSQVSHTPSSRFLAEEIMEGKTEDPFDYARMNRYTTSAKLPAPIMGPARYQDLKMFAKVDRNVPEIEALAMRPHQELPPPPKPDWLDLAIGGMMKPNLDEAFDSLPMTELCRAINPSTAGVICVSDIPYTATKQELTAFVGRQAQINRMPDGSPYHAVHIMMERESGKTLDCYIEVATANEAIWCTRQLNKRAEDGRPPKVGSRNVKVTTCTQDELMAELFPRAKHVRWVRGQPIVDQTKRQYYEDSPADGFSGFVHTEEFHALIKHANQSERAPFISKSPCRVYEMMITMLYKYPWFAPDLVTVRERRAMYDTATKLITCLCDYIRKHEYDKHPQPLEPNKTLLQELVSAALFCPGFSEKQKAYLNGVVKSQGFGAIADGKGVNIAVGGIHPLAIHWPFSALSIYPGVSYNLVEYYARLFREATSANKSGSRASSLAARQMAKATGYEMQPMGNLNFAYGDTPDTLSLADIAAVEYHTIEQLLKTVCHDQGQHDTNGMPPSAPTFIGPGYGNGRGGNGQGSNGSSTRTHSS